MRFRSKRGARFVAPLMALLIIGALFAMSRQPSLSDQEGEELAGHFRFTKLAFPELRGYPRKMIREVHPSLRHISALISFVGAAVQ